MPVKWSRLPSSSPSYLSPRQGGGCSTTTNRMDSATRVQMRKNMNHTHANFCDYSGSLPCTIPQRLGRFACLGAEGELCSRSCIAHLQHLCGQGDPCGRPYYTTNEPLKPRRV
ncbi:MAG: hypothetical protein ACJ788_19895 [Ktedonobacteraceae bacterium]